MAVTKASNSSVRNKSPKYVSFLAGNAAYIPPAFESIATATGTGSSGTITFSSIPSTYKHLQIRYIGRSDEVATVRNLNIRLNGDTGTNYVYHNLTGDGTTATAAGVTAVAQMLVRPIPAASASANIMGAGIIDIHDYASTTKNKTVRTFVGADANTASTDWKVSLFSGLWLNTAAITSISLIAQSGNFTTDSTFALYGIKGA